MIRVDPGSIPGIRTQDFLFAGSYDVFLVLVALSLHSERFSTLLWWWRRGEKGQELEVSGKVGRCDLCSRKPVNLGIHAQSCRAPQTQLLFMSEGDAV